MSWQRSGGQTPQGQYVPDGPYGSHSSLQYARPPPGGAPSDRGSYDGRYDGDVTLHRAYNDGQPNVGLLRDGPRDGRGDGPRDGHRDGSWDGHRDGARDGYRDGPRDGLRDGSRDGHRDGSRDGPRDGHYSAQPSPRTSYHQDQTYPPQDGTYFSGPQSHPPQSHLPQSHPPQSHVPHSHQRTAETSGHPHDRNQQQYHDVTSQGQMPSTGRPSQADEGHYSVHRPREGHSSRPSSEGHYSTLRSNESTSSTTPRSSLHSKQPSDASSRDTKPSRKTNTNGYSRSPERTEPPTVMEAAQVVEILRRQIAYLSGGRDRRGGPVLTLPTHQLTTDFPPQDIIACLSYLASVPSEESAAKGFSVIVDNREGYWRNLRTLFRAIQQSLGGRIHGVYVLRPDQILDRQRLNLSFRKDKTPLSFEPQFITVARLQGLVDPGQLTTDVGGTMAYNHDTWLNNRLALERFLRESRSVSRHLDTAMAQLTARLRREETTCPQDLLRQHRYLQESVLQSPEHVIRQGRLLYDQLESDSEAGFRRDTSTMTLDQVVALNQVKRAVETLERRLDKLQDFWQERDRELSQTVQYSDLEAAMKTVVDWIVGPAEKLLRSQADIGENYKTADELRKQHEQLELKCTDTYGTYAELRHRVDELIKEGHEKADDVSAQRDYMDTVCRSYAARLERRRNLVITSVRFHRLAEELSRRLDDLLELLCTDIVAGDVETVGAALRLLQEKVDTITVAAEQTVSEGQSLLDQLSLPVKNAFGKDVTPDNAARTAHVQKLLDELNERKVRADELAGVRKLKLQQILQLRTCERDADQAIRWILELCDVMMASQMELGKSPTEAEQMQVEHQKFETTAKGTYEYGKQLLQAALVLRRSLRYDLEPNNRQGQQLAAAWKKFSQGINERAIRLNNVFIFNKNADALLENVEEMILVISRCVNLEITVEDLVTGYESSRDHMKRQYDETMKLGEDLLQRLAMPVLTLDGDEKHFTLDDEGTSEVIKGKMALLKTKMTNLKRYWDEQTQGLHLGLDGELLGPDGRVIRPAPAQGQNGQADNANNKIKHVRHTIGLGSSENFDDSDDETFESRKKRMAEMHEEVKETLASRKSLWDDLMEQTPTRPTVNKNKTNQRATEAHIIPMSVEGQSLQRTPDSHTESLRSPEASGVEDSVEGSFSPQQVAPLEHSGSLGSFNEGMWETEWQEVESRLRDGAPPHHWAFMAGSLPSSINSPNACWGQEQPARGRARALSF